MTDSLYVRDTVNLFLFFTFFCSSLFFLMDAELRVRPVKEKMGYTPERGDASHPSSLTVKTTSRVQERKKKKEERSLFTQMD